VVKKNQLRPDRVRGKGDVPFKRFECLNPVCEETLVVLEADCGSGFSITCPACDYLHFDGGSLHLFDYALVHRESGDTINSGPFAPTHNAYLALAERVKYCVLCYTLQPLDSFDRHGSRVTGRQGECRMCKKLYNDLKNESRLTEQHREAAETRRLLTILSGETDIGAIDELLARFDYQCFNCLKPLKDSPGGDDGYYIDHTLPVSWLWPLDLGPTILCRQCNGRKSDHWPSEFYGEVGKLRALATRTGIPFDQLCGPPFFNPAAIKRLQAEADSIIERWVQHPAKLRALKIRIEAATGENVFRDADPASLRAIGLSS
jgi:5-methylcytosine-specific restriction endonuclease McrA